MMDQPRGSAPGKGGEAGNPDKTPRTERGRRTLRKLLDAAAIEFGERGFHEASISGITRRAGVAWSAGGPAARAALWSAYGRASSATGVARARASRACCSFIRAPRPRPP